MSDAGAGRTDPGADPGADPVAARRARIGRFVAAATRAGYLCLLVSAVGFAAGIATDFAGWAVAVATGGLVAATVILPVPIIVGYGVRAAEREERRGGRGRGH